MKILALAIAIVFGTVVAQAAPEPADPKKRTPQGLYLSATEAGAMMAERGGETLFIDVREPVEIMFTGYTDMVDANVPFMLVNPAKWHPKKPMLAMERDPGFIAGIERALAAEGLNKDAPIVLMCRSGTRSGPAAALLAKQGYTQVYSVVDGFEGSAAKDDPNGPWRNVNGWKNSGLPWSYALDPAKIYLRPEE